MPPLVAKIITFYISHMGVLLILTWTTENYTLTQCFRCGFNIFVYTEKVYVIAQSNRLYSYIHVTQSKSTFRDVPVIV